MLHLDTCSIRCRAMMLRCLLLAVVLFSEPSLLRAQVDGGRAGFGFNAGLAKYFGEFSDNSWWFGGDAFIRYNVTSVLALQAQFNIANPRFRVNVDNAISKYTDYYGTGPNAREGGYYPNGTRIPGGEVGEDGRNNIRIFSPELLVCINLLPSQRFNPYIFGGVGLMNFQVRPGLAGGGGLGPGGTVGVLPGQAAGLYSTSGFNGGLIFPAGIGFEMYLTDDLVLNGRGTFRFTSTPWLDDYNPGSMKDGNGQTLPAPPGVTPGKNDAFMTIGIGLSYYVFGNADFDGDGIPNSQERIIGTDENNPDTDGDGLPDGFEYNGTRVVPKGWTADRIARLPETSERSDPRKADTDGDGLSDYEELTGTHTKLTVADTDGDGLNDGAEIARKTDPLKADSDGDGLLDGDEVATHKTDPLKPDTDGDKLSDGEEVRKYGTNPLATDTDSDGLADGDEVMTYKTNPAQADTDGDGLRDGEEVRTYKTDPLKADSDGDKLTDGEEIRTHKTDPLKADSDNDGLTDGDEVAVYKTNPLSTDTDGDKLADGEEVRTYKTDPTKTDTDSDGLADGDEIATYKTDPTKADTDGDGCSDGKEVTELRTNPLVRDTDGDSIEDCVDPCPTEKGLASKEDAEKAKVKPGCPGVVVGTKIDFPDILFIVNTDEFNFKEPSTIASLRKLLEYMQQCDNLGVIIEGHASEEGNPKRNQVLSEKRAKKVRQWLIEQGVPPSKIIGAIGYGTTRPKIKERKDMTPQEREEARKVNRRITISVERPC